MLFVVQFPNLCYEVAKHCKLDKRHLLDTEGNVIMDFSPKGIKNALCWRRYGDEYIEANFVAFHDSTTKLGDYIRNWLYTYCQGIQDQRWVSARKEGFIPIVSKLITLLSRVTGQENDTKYRKEFTGFIVMISSKRSIRWSKVINDALRHQLAYLGSSKKFYMNSYLVYLLLPSMQGTCGTHPYRVPYIRGTRVSVPYMVRIPHPIRVLSRGPQNSLNKINK